MSKNHVNEVLKKLNKLGYNAKALVTNDKLKKNYTWDMVESKEQLKNYYKVLRNRRN